AAWGSWGVPPTGGRAAPRGPAAPPRRRLVAPPPPLPARPLRPPGAVRADRRRRPAALPQDPPQPGPLLGQRRRRAGALPGGVLRPRLGLDARRAVRSAAQGVRPRRQPPRRPAAGRRPLRHRTTVRAVQQHARRGEAAPLDRVPRGGRPAAGGPAVSV